MSLTVTCPDCGTALEVDDEYRTWKVRCPSCRHEFYPTTSPTRDDDDDDDCPRRRRRKPRFDERDYADAAHDVSAPSYCLEILGWLGLLGTIAGIVLFVFIAAAAANNPFQQQNGDLEVLICMGTCTGIFAVPYHLAIIYGARKMRRLSNRGWAMASAILASSMFVLFNFMGILHAAPGVWALVVMDKAHVKAAFEHNARQYLTRDEG